MNPYTCRVVLRPRGPLEVFDLSFRFLRVHPIPYLRLSIGLMGPFWLLCIFGTWWTDGSPAMLVIPIILGPVIQAPFTILTARLMFDADYTAAHAVRDLLTVFPAYIAACGLTACAWFVGLLSCGVMLLPCEVVIIYLFETSLLERVGLRRTIGRTTHLVSSHLGMGIAGVVGRWVLMLWFALICEFGGQAMTNSVLQIGTPIGTLQAGSITPWFLGGMLLGQAFAAVYRLFLYVDVRTRQEGWDLQVALRALGAAR